MLCPHLYASAALAEHRIKAIQNDREVHSAMRLVRANRRSWRVRSASALLSRLGHLLVAWGRRLERYELSSHTPSA